MNSGIREKLGFFKMKFIDEFRDPEKARFLQNAIAQKMREVEIRLGASGSGSEDRKSPALPLKVMEFCGGHTHTLFQYDIESLLPDSIEMVHGPGCPVCILPMNRVDDCIRIAERPEVIFTTFGDAMRIPGSRGSLLDAKARGADIRMVYSPMDALDLARREPDREVVFFALGFDTTMPSTALTVQQAKREDIRNFSLFCNHVLTEPTLEAVLNEPDLDLAGFIAPGHVGMVVGLEPFRKIAERYRKPLVVSGFEPLDILQGLLLLATQFAEGRCEVENQYSRIVRTEGNRPGLEAIEDVYEGMSSVELRGFGSIGQAGVTFRPAYRAWDAEQKFGFKRSTEQLPEAAGAECSSVLKGQLRPWDCPLYGMSCTPKNPIGALMVSSEGACAACYNSGKRLPDQPVPAVLEV